MEKPIAAKMATILITLNRFFILKLLLSEAVCKTLHINGKGILQEKYYAESGENINVKWLTKVISRYL